MVHSQGTARILPRGYRTDKLGTTLDQYRIVYRIEGDVAIVQVLKAGKKHPGFYDDIA